MGHSCALESWGEATIGHGGGGHRRPVSGVTREQGKGVDTVRAGRASKPCAAICITWRYRAYVCSAAGWMKQGGWRRSGSQ